MFTKLISWLSKRFPEKMELTLLEYNELREEMGQYNIGMQQLGELNRRLSVLEKEVKQLNAANGFVQGPKGGFRLER